ncbi:MAG: hypothetical protein OEU91_00095 [Gammaproteobacteria bacterium]|nr:hypothetical protein [Gammaproteobacteria bacterium]
MPHPDFRKPITGYGYIVVSDVIGLVMHRYKKRMRDNRWHRGQGIETASHSLLHSNKV